jgi:Bacterial pre-peptidase C-terminal domain
MPPIAVTLLPLLLLAQPKKPEPKDQPRVLVMAPLGMAPGSATKLTIRGLKIDNATEVRLPGTKGSAKILGKSKVAVPNTQKPEKVGDSEVQVEITLPADVVEGSVPVVVVTPGGTTMPHKLLVARGVLAEKEPNNGYRQAQPLPLPAIVDGTIGTAQDVDVFSIQGKAGQKIVAEVFAARHGSPLDGVLTLIDERGAILASNDDAEGLDPKLEFTLPRDGTYYLSLIDAHDQGGPIFVYRLVVRIR